MEMYWNCAKSNSVLNKNEWNSFQDRENQDPEKRKSFGRKKIQKKGNVSGGKRQVGEKTQWEAKIWYFWENLNRSGKTQEILR